MDKSFIKSSIKKFTTRFSTSFFLDDRNNLSESFSGDELMVAEQWKKSLQVESSECGVTHQTVPNARSRTILELTKPKIKELKNPCSRCGGTGIMPYRHIKNGTCFKCEGSGKNST